LSLRDDVTLGHADLGDRPAVLGEHRDLHLHRLEHEQGVAGRDLVVGGDDDRDDVRDHLGADLGGHGSSCFRWGSGTPILARPGPVGR